MRIDGDPAVGMQEERISVGRGFRDRLGGDVAVGAGSVFDHDRPPQRFLHVMGKQPRGYVRGAARRDRHQDLIGRDGKVPRLRTAPESAAKAGPRCVSDWSSPLPPRPALDHDSEPAPLRELAVMLHHRRQSCLRSGSASMNILLLGSGGREHALAWKIDVEPARATARLRAGQCRYRVNARWWRSMPPTTAR